MTTGSEASSQAPKRRTLGQQLNRSPRVMHASWMIGVAVLAGLVTTGVGPGDVLGLLFLAVYFVPVYVAFIRDRLTFRIIFATIFLPTWPWAAYLAFRRTPASD